MKSFRFIFIRLCLYLFPGILAGFYISISNRLSFLIVGLTLMTFVAVYLITRKQLFHNSLPGIATFLLIFSLGFSSAHFSQPKYQPFHYTKFQNSDNPPVLKAHITEVWKPTRFGQRYILKTDELIYPDSSTKVHGKILLNLNNSLQNKSLVQGTSLLLPFDPQEIKPAMNPFQFSYREYLNKMGIESQLNLRENEIKLFNTPAISLLQKAGELRSKIINKLGQKSFTSSELAIFQALVLGERSNISDEIYQNYAAAGAIHILAISGLHIGILLWLFNFILQPLERIKFGKTLKTILLIALLWGFAFLTGLSPSVVRAVCMFSFIAIGIQLNRKTSTLNSIFVSLFILLLINPYYIFQVGFQLSYLAVTGIVIFYPHIYKVIKVRQRWLDYFWKLTAVSLSAQIAILPLSLFYFHQFPGLFLLTNLVILPLLAIILCFGIVVTVLAVFNILPEFLADGYGRIISGMNKFVEAVASFENFVFHDIRFSVYQVMAYFLILITLIVFLGRKSFRTISLLLLAVILFQIATLAEIKSIPSEELIVFGNTNESIIAKKQKNKLLVPAYSQKVPKNYIRERKIKNIALENGSSILQFSGKTILTVDSTAIYNVQGLSPEIVILKDSPKVNLERLISILNPEQIVADNSNPAWLINKWKETCRNKKIPFHYTGEKGAFIISSE